MWVRASLIGACLAAIAACGRAKAVDAPADAAAVHTNAASVEADASFVSAAAELAAPIAPSHPGDVRPLVLAPLPLQTLSVPGGTFASGSAPGAQGREPAVEPVLVPVTLGPFAMDALPYPNDPTAAPNMVSSPEEAAKLCNDRGARLCTELEWERACKGPDGDVFATGSTWNDACDRSPSRCASGFGVRGMGFLGEWTDSRFGDGRRGPVVRGGPKGGRRCAARSRGHSRAQAETQLAFRCCHGDRNDVVAAKIEAKVPFRTTELEASDLAKIFAKVPELARISEGVRLFSDADVKSILDRSETSGKGITFVTSPILWSPEPGVEMLVATGRAKKTGFIVALWTLPGDEYRLASSFLLLNDPAPIALAYEPSRRNELRWTTCWHCAGEQGGVSLKDDGRVVIVQF